MTLATPIHVTDHMVDFTVAWARRAGKMILAFEKEQDFPCDPSGCTSYAQFGQPGYQCEYIPACLCEDWTRMKNLYEPTVYPTFENVRKTLAESVIVPVTVKGDSYAKPQRTPCNEEPALLDGSKS